MNIRYILNQSSVARIEPRSKRSVNTKEFNESMTVERDKRMDRDWPATKVKFAEAEQLIRPFK